MSNQLDMVKKKEHCVKMPQLYKNASKILEKIENGEGNLKSIIFNGNYRNSGPLLGLVKKLLDNRTAIMTAIAKSNLLVEETKFNTYVAQVFTTQLLVKGAVNGDCKPIQVFNKYAKKIKAEAENLINKEQLQHQRTLPRYVRVNTFMTSVDEVHAQLEREGATFDYYDHETETYDGFLKRVENLAEGHYLADYHIPDLLVFQPSTVFSDCRMYHEGALILQDKASCIPPVVCNAVAGSSVLDACAAPGNKASQMAARVTASGKMVAVEYDRVRFESLQKLLGRYGAAFVSCLNEDFSKINPKDYSDVEYILVDPSCSSSGAEIHKDDVSKKRIKALSNMQALLLKRALLFPNVKEVIYSTCSVHEEENENVVSEILDKFHKKFEIANLGDKFPGWKHFGLPKYSFGHKCLRTYKDVDKCHGFFIAKFVRKSECQMGKRKMDESSRIEPEPDNKKCKKEKKTVEARGNDTEIKIEGKEKEQHTVEASKSEKKKKKKKSMQTVTAVEGCLETKIKKKKKKQAVKAMEECSEGEIKEKKEEVVEVSERRKKKKKSKSAAKVNEGKGANIKKKKKKASIKN